MTKKYIVTDPCYIIHRVAYDTLGAVFDWEFERIKMPLTVPYTQDVEKITLHKIVGTGGDGSAEYDGQMIAVDAGMLCLAEKETGWNEEHYGAKFETKEEAENGLKEIMKAWN